MLHETVIKVLWDSLLCILKLLLMYYETAINIIVKLLSMYSENAINVSGNCFQCTLWNSFRCILKLLLMYCETAFIIWRNCFPYFLKMLSTCRETAFGVIILKQLPVYLEATIAAIKLLKLSWNCYECIMKLLLTYHRTFINISWNYFGCILEQLLLYH